MQQNNHLLSVIVPVYNTEVYLPSCIDSIIAQSWKDIEIIIVDDCSPDKAPKIADSYARKYPTIQVIHNKKNLGLLRARIVGLSHMRGNYFTFVDSDDSVGIDYYRPMMERALKDDADIVVGDYVEKHEDGTFVYPNGYLQQYDGDLWGERILESLLCHPIPDWSFPVVWNKIYHRHLYDDTASYLQTITQHIVMCEDVVFSTLFCANAKHLAIVHGEYYFYTKRQESSTGSKVLTYKAIARKCIDTEASFHLAEQYLMQHNVPLKYLQYFNLWRTGSMPVDEYKRKNKSKHIREEKTVKNHKPQL